MFSSKFPTKISLHDGKFACFASTCVLEIFYNATCQQPSQLGEPLCCKQILHFNFYKKVKIDFSEGFDYNSSLCPTCTSTSSCCAAPKAGTLPATPQCSHLVPGTQTAALLTPQLPPAALSTAPCSKQGMNVLPMQQEC